MTAEVAILTKQCVALAADSAVTTGSHKIFNTVNKLFALSKQQPVGIMVYSSAELMGVPVETIIKEFRRLRRDSKCDHLEGYAREFEEFLRTNNDLFLDDGRLQDIVSQVRTVIDTIGRRTYVEWQSCPQTKPVSVSEIFRQVLDDLESRSFEIHCSGPGVHKVRGRYGADISLERIATIKPFAQDDVMRTFIQGIDPTYSPAIKGYLKEYFAERIQIMSASKQRGVSAVKAIGDDLVNGFSARLAEISEDFTGPLMRVAASMPKEELALLAEALVNLTALKRKASTDTETVGGPTDVAVISKGDGFIWIKHKHYFEPNLNPGFCATYMEERL